MFDIITFGSAAQDIHIKSKEFKILENKVDFVTGEGICLPFGSKVDVEDVIFESGGGGTNTAAAFAKQGFRVAICCAIGVDISGLEIVRELKQLRVDTRFLLKKKEKHTNQSIIISTNGQDRTILVYRGASELMCKDDIPWKKLRAKWFYLAPLAGSLCLPAGRQATVFEELVDFAHQNKIKIAANPSKQQLSMPLEDIKRIFSKIDILFLNKEEAGMLSENLRELCPGIIAVTKGGEGVDVYYDKYIYSAKPDPSRKIVDTTGAGDSFASGFLSGYIRFNGDIVKSIQLGLANSEANIAEIGAKTGLLTKKSDFKRVEVLKQDEKI